VANRSLLDRLRGIVGSEHLVTHERQLATYASDGLLQYAAHPVAVVLPGSAEEVAAVVRACHEEEVPWVARGAGSGLSGGALPVEEGVLIALSRLRRILEIDVENGRVLVEPGVTNIAVSQAEKGDVAGAVAIARSLDDRAAAAAALFGVLRVQSERHDISGLRETIGVTLQAVRVIGSTELRAGALGSLAAAHIREGDVEGAQAVFAEAMNTAAAADRGRQRAAVYARIADSLADRHRPFND